MSENPKRQFWQIRLSTAIAMALAYGLYVWLSFGRIIDRTPESGYVTIDHGFPARCCYETNGPLMGGGFSHEFHWYTGGVIIDLTFGVLLDKGTDYSISARAQIK